MKEIKLYISSWMIILPLVVSIFFFVSVINTLINDTNAPMWVVWFPIIIFGIFSLVLLFSLFFRRQLTLIINETGISGRNKNLILFEWSFINDAYFKRILFFRFICLVVDINFKPKAEFSFFPKRSQKNNGNKFTKNYYLPVSSLKVHDKKFLELIKNMINAENKGLDKQEILRNFSE
jgi:hypothetical protein